MEAREGPEDEAGAGDEGVREELEFLMGIAGETAWMDAMASMAHRGGAGELV